MGKQVLAIVRGPKPYFNGESLFAPGQQVMVDEDLVSDKDTIVKTVKVRLKEPVLVDGKLVREAEEDIAVRTQFLPAGSAPVAEQPTTTAEIATGNLDRLNVTDFLKKSADEIGETIGNGSVDDFLDIIEQAEISGKGRKSVKEAISARRASK